MSLNVDNEYIWQKALYHLLKYHEIEEGINECVEFSLIKSKFFNCSVVFLRYTIEIFQKTS